MENKTVPGGRPTVWDRIGKHSFLRDHGGALELMIGNRDIALILDVYCTKGMDDMGIWVWI